MVGAVLAELVWRQEGAARASLPLIIDHLTFQIKHFHISNSRYLTFEIKDIQILSLWYCIKDYSRKKVTDMTLKFQR